jgi:hypothetical protein
LRIIIHIIKPIEIGQARKNRYGRIWSTGNLQS